MHRCRGALRTYAWGSRTAIAGFTGRPTPTPHPEAELWFGAHPGDPAVLDTPSGAVSLLDAIDADPLGQLGEATHRRFDGRLPFLLKVLAADEPLSLQAHPSSAQAAEGFDREERLGVPVGSPTRNYKDRSHKPELVLALTPFEALAGFRDPDVTAAFLTALDVPALTPFAALLRTATPADGLRALFTTWITLPQPDLDGLVPAVLDGAVALLRRGEDRFAAEARTVLELGERYPGDAGVLAAMLLNRLELAPGEALFLPAGNLHAYLRGLGVELMANSDNVLRGGMTPKHVDVPELLRVLDFSPASPDSLRPETVELGGERHYRTPFAEFAASTIDLTPDPPGDPRGRAAVDLDDADGPQMLLCLDGAVTLTASPASEDGLVLARGEAAWVPAGRAVRAAASGTGDGAARLFRATVGHRRP